MEGSVSFPGGSFVTSETLPTAGLGSDLAGAGKALQRELPVPCLPQDSPGHSTASRPRTHARRQRSLASGALGHCLLLSQRVQPSLLRWRESCSEPQPHEARAGIRHGSKGDSILGAISGGPGGRRVWGTCRIRVHIPERVQGWTLGPGSRLSSGTESDSGRDTYLSGHLRLKRLLSFPSDDLWCSSAHTKLRIFPHCHRRDLGAGLNRRDRGAHLASSDLVFGLVPRHLCPPVTCKREQEGGWEGRPPTAGLGSGVADGGEHEVPVSARHAAGGGRQVPGVTDTHGRGGHGNWGSPTAPVRGWRQ